jgi:hypothetical protein
MKQTISEYQFVDAFRSANRENNFSIEGRMALYGYITELEEETGNEFELDVIAICCDFDEYDNLDEVKENYSDINSIDDLRDNTVVIEIPDSERLIIGAF